MNTNFPDKKIIIAVFVCFNFFLLVPFTQAEIKKTDSQKTKLAKIKKQFDAGQIQQVLQNIQTHNLTTQPQSQYMLATIYRASQNPQVSPVQIAALFQNACDGSYAPAYQHCATNYIEGIGRLQDFEKAQRYFKKAEKANQLDAIHLYALLLLQGQVFPLDRAKAYTLLKKAAEKDHPPSQYALGNLYRSGLGVDKNFDKAYTWYHKAATNKIVDALLVLGQIHETGEEDAKKKDIKIAHQFYNLASSLASDTARQKVITLTSTMQLKEVTEAQKSAQQWIKRYWDKAKK